MSGNLAMAKLAINIVAGLGVSKVVNDIITNNTTIETTGDAIRVWAGSLVIGSMAAEAGSKHVNAKVDQLANWYEKRRVAAEEEARKYRSNR
jgi:hypothetical protein